MREVERRIQTVETHGDDAGLPALERPRGIPETFDEHVKLMFELQWLAFQADITRVVTFMLGRELNFRTYPEIGITEGHHGAVASPATGPSRSRSYAKLNTYQTRALRVVPEKLRRRPTATARCSTTRCSCTARALSNPNLHAHYDLPLALVGGAGGRSRAAATRVPEPRRR